MEILERRCLLSGTALFIGGQRLGSTEAYGVELGDLDGDGDEDAFVAHLSEGVLEEFWVAAPNKVWLNDGTGTFTDSGQNLGSHASQSIALGDLNGDTFLDAFVGNIGSNKVWLNDGSGSFTDSGQALGSSDSHDVALADLDGDGDLDAVVANLPAGTGNSPVGEVWINQGVNTGVFTSLGSNLWTNAGGLAVGDVDGDGDTDAFVTRLGMADDEEKNALADLLWLNDGTGHFTMSSQSFGVRETLGVALADFDGDGDLDIFSAGHGEGVSGRLFINQGRSQSGTEGTFADTGQDIGTGGINRIDVADLDGDSDLDIFATVSVDIGAAPTDRVYLNQLNGVGGPVMFEETGQILALTDSLDVALADLNADGTIDAFVGNADDSSIAESRIWLNHADPVVTYSVNGNVPISVPGAAGVLAPFGSVTIDSVDATGLAGTLNLNQLTGAFEYTPRTGFRGVDTFTTELSDGRSVVVALDVYAAMWFVDPAAAPGGDGSLAAPFQSLAPLNDSLNDADVPGDLIFVHGNNSFDVAAASGFELEFGQSLITSSIDPFNNPRLLADIDHALAAHSFGLPTGFTSRPQVKNSTLNAPVFSLTGHNLVSGVTVNPAGSSEAFLLDEVEGEIYLREVNVTPDAGNHAYNGITATNSALFLSLRNFEVNTTGQGTTAGTTFHFDSNASLEFQGSQILIDQSGGGLLNVTNTRQTGEVVFDGDSSLQINGGDFGIHLQNNPGAQFQFSSELFLFGATDGITAIDSGTVEFPDNQNSGKREVAGIGGTALRIERTSTGTEGWFLDDVVAESGTHGIVLNEVTGSGLTIQETELVDLNTTAITVTDSPGINFRTVLLTIDDRETISGTVAGTGVAGNSGDSGAATAAQLNSPAGVAVDRRGNTLIADSAANVIRRVDRSTGIITTIAGTGDSGYSGDGATAASAQLSQPANIIVDAYDNLYFSDRGNQRIRRIDAATGIITTVAGNGSSGFSGDGGPATDAMLDGPAGLTIHPLDGSLYFSDQNNHRIRRIDRDTGTISTVVGTGETGISPEETAPDELRLNSPAGLLFLHGQSVAQSDLLVVDAGSHRVLQIDWSADESLTYIGTGVAGNNGTANSDAQMFQLDSPESIMLSPTGGVLISDTGNHRLVLLDFQRSDQLSAEVIAGTGIAGFAGDGADMSSSQYASPTALAVTPDGSLLIADEGNHRIRSAVTKVSAGAGIDLQDNADATFTFDQLVVATTGDAFVADGSGTINIGDSSPDYQDWSVYGTRAILSAEDGRGLAVTGTELSNGDRGFAKFRNITSVNSPMDAILLDHVSGDICVETSYIEGANRLNRSDAAAVNIVGGDSNVTIHATIFNSQGRAISVAGRTDGEVHLVTPIQNSDGTTNPVNISNNTAGSTTLYRPLMQAPVTTNNGQHLVSLLNKGEAPACVVPILRIDADSTTIWEHAGSAATLGRVTRNTVSDTDLTVILTSSNASEAAVPETVTIPAGEMSATFDISAIDDDMADGIQLVTLTATAVGFNSDSVELDVADDDFHGHVIDFEEFETGEEGGERLAVDDDFLAQYGITRVSVSDGNQLEVWPAQGPGFEHEVNPGAGNFFGQGQDAPTTNSARTLTFEFADGLRRFAFRRVGGSNLTSAPHWTARAYSALGEVIACLGEVELSYNGHPFFLLREPERFEFLAPEGQTIERIEFDSPLQRSTFGVVPMDNIEVEFLADLQLTVTPMLFNENAGATAATATLTRNTNTAGPLTVTLTSSDTSEATVPASVTIPAGQSSVQFDIAAIDDALVDGNQSVTLTASAADLSNAQASVSVTDNETAALSLNLNAEEISEAAGAAATTGTVTRNTPADTALTVTLTSSDTTEATVPVSVTIPAGQSSVQFDVAAVNDADADGTQTVTVTASATGFEAGSDTVDVTDDEVVPAVLSPSGPIESFRPTITWASVAGAVTYELWLERIGGAANPVLNPTTSQTEFTPDTDLGIGGFRAWVRARLTNGAWTEWGFTAFRIEPAVSINELPFHGTDLTPTISWAGQLGAESYRVYIANITAGAVVTDEIVTGTTFTPGADFEFGKHSIWVRSVATGGFLTHWSDRIDYYIGPAQINPFTSTIDTTPTFRWESMSNVASVQLYVLQGSNIIVNEVGITGTSYTVSTSLTQNLYRWWIRATHTNGRAGAWSPPGQLEIGNRPLVIAPESTTKDSNVLVKWTDERQAASYEVYLYNDSGLGLIERETGITETERQYPPLPDGDYRAWIRGYSAEGVAGDWSRPHRFTIDAATSNVGVTLTGPIGPTLVTEPTFRWTADADAASFDFYATDGNTVIEETGFSETSYTPQLPLNSQPLQWWVRARNAAGDAGPWFSAETDLSGRPVIIPLSGPFNQPRPTFFWEAVEAADHYIFYLSRGNAVVLHDDNVQLPELTPESDLLSGSYRLWIQAVDSAGRRSPWSLPYEFEIEL